MAYCMRSACKLLFADVNKTAMKIQSDLKPGMVTSQPKGLFESAK